MNLTVTNLQVRICTSLMVQNGQSTYELSRKLRMDFWRVQQACQSLYDKAYLDNKNKSWSLRGPEKEDEPASKYDDDEGDGLFLRLNSLF